MYFSIVRLIRINLKANLNLIIKAKHYSFTSLLSDRSLTLFKFDNFIIYHVNVAPRRVVLRFILIKLESLTSIKFLTLFINRITFR